MRVESMGSNSGPSPVPDVEQGGGVLDSVHSVQIRGDSDQTDPVPQDAQTVALDPSRGFILYRGMRNTNMTDAFAEKGGTEMAFMSTTCDLAVAVRYAISNNSLIFKIIVDGFMTMGADLRWLSAFPGEAEFLYPPITYLKPVGEWRSATIPVKKGEEIQNYKIVEVRPVMG